MSSPAQPVPRGSAAGHASPEHEENAPYKRNDPPLEPSRSESFGPHGGDESRPKLSGELRGDKSAQQDSQDEHPLPVDFGPVLGKIGEFCHVPRGKDLFDDGGCPGECGGDPKGVLPSISQTSSEAPRPPCDVRRPLLLPQPIHLALPLTHVRIHATIGLRSAERPPLQTPNSRRGNQQPGGCISRARGNNTVRVSTARTCKDTS